MFFFRDAYLTLSTTRNTNKISSLQIFLCKSRVFVLLPEYNLMSAQDSVVKASGTNWTISGTALESRAIFSRMLPAASKDLKWPYWLIFSANLECTLNAEKSSLPEHGKTGIFFLLFSTSSFPCSCFIVVSDSLNLWAFLGARLFIRIKHFEVKSFNAKFDHSITASKHVEANSTFSTCWFVIEGSPS